MKIEEHIIKSSSAEYSRKVWVLEAGSETPERLAVFLDGEFYVNRMDTPSVLIDLQKSRALPSMLYVFVSHVNGEARHRDLTCNPSYSEFIATDVVQWSRERNNAIHERNHVIAGPSLGGLASAYLSLTCPEIFPSCLSHSGSFWWKDEWLTCNLQKMPAGKNKFWISVGDKEIESGVSHPPTGLRQDVTQVAACERFATTLLKRGDTVHYEVYEGGHEIKPWKEELPKALCWLLGKDAAS